MKSHTNRQEHKIGLRGTSRIAKLALFLVLGLPVVLGSQLAYGGGAAYFLSSLSLGVFSCIRTLINPPFDPPNVGGLLGANTLVSDPFSGAKVVRVTDYNTLGTAPVQPSYQVDPGGSAEVNFMDSSDNYFYVSDTGACIEPFTWNAETMQATRMYVSSYPSTNGMRICTASTGGEFSYRVPGRMYDMEYGASNNHNPEIFYYDFTQSSPPSRTSVFDFGSSSTCAPPGVTFEGQTQWGDPPTVSADDQTFGTSISTVAGQGNAEYVVVYNRTRGCAWWDTATGQVGGPWGSSGPVTGVSETFKVHNARLSLDGRWMRIDRQGCISGGGTGGSCVYTVYFWQIGTTNITASTVQNSGHLALGYSHAVNDSTYPDQQSVEMAPMNTPASAEELWVTGPSEYGPWDAHFSWQNANRADSNLVFASTFTTGIEIPTQAWNNEIDGFSANGSGAVCRFGRNYITANPAATFAASQGIGSISADARFFGFASDWNCQLGSTSGGSTGTQSPYNCRADVFILQTR
jgi:hypothetical protein